MNLVRSLFLSSIMIITGTVRVVVVYSSKRIVDKDMRKISIVIGGKVRAEIYLPYYVRKQIKHVRIVGSRKLGLFRRDPTFLECVSPDGLASNQPVKTNADFNVHF